MKKDSALLQTKPSQADNSIFQGTDNPRELRAISALLKRPHWRKEIDNIAGCSNTPDLISRIKKRGLDIRCKREIVIDRDGKKCRSGIYYLTQSAIRKIKIWLKRREQSQFSTGS
ncbi:MAG: hypothetical protein KGO49_10720 [Gammaproteobacteria bacterium]|nr:hypothetical protein [Gammaproteobacteria bacterium]